MKKFWIVYSEKNIGQFSRFDSPEEATDEAKRKAASGVDEYIILEAIATTKKPVPPIEIITL